MTINYKKEIIIRSIKIFDIGFITALYIVLGVILAIICDKYFSKFDKYEEEKNQFGKLFLK
jgi:hypothetical protein